MIAVIGGGASGTLTAISLLREATGRRLPVRVALIDRHGRHGLGQAYSTTTDPLLRHLLNFGLGHPDPLRLGLDTDDRGALRDTAGRPTGCIFALGPLLRGRWYETTAIPEIRDQAVTLARHLLTTQAHATPSSAA